ncbi:NADH dehydrogenase [ubiquinone] 1 alpha subcomplex subunit 10, mitochondrial-like [Saccostrea cucullata]|uniref:NADH dehydrogenase [ubiquinone] 1 alpha subcomplex subunit 10, mitochondrial-like n=1 Tax=Saccostrea cuccullata TaxID=36930 RepID=UPI002ED66F57
MASLGARLLTSGSSCAKGFLKAPLLTAVLPGCTQVANLRSKNDPFPLPPREKPFKHRFNCYWQPFESNIHRMNENSIVIIVDGNIGTGKKDLAKKIAEEFDLRYIEDVDYDKIYISRELWGHFDMREVNACAPNRTMFNSLETFWATKKLEDNSLIMKTQWEMYYYRWNVYIDALKHIVNTGQGVVLSRNLYSDIAFSYAMLKKKLYNKRVYEQFEDYVEGSFHYLWAPHLCIYLDATPAYCMKKIKERKVPFEMNSPILNEEFLALNAEGYEKKALPKLEPFSEIMVLDADNLPDFDLVKELEKIDFNPFKDTLLRDDKFLHWRHVHERSWADWRRWYVTSTIEVLLSVCE